MSMIIKKTEKATKVCNSVASNYFVLPVILQAAGLLTTFSYPDHIVYLCSSGYLHLPPTCSRIILGIYAKRLYAIYLKYDEENSSSLSFRFVDDN
ncbi:hypothetical protein C9446_16075 [Providencia heimbachae]|nr:hypothetical protein C9446_16075 [Providencia heimbachae]